MVNDIFFVSIVVPTYNRALSIHKTLNSIKEQTHDNWECLVIDDKSTDNTKKVIMDYSKEDSRFRYLINDRAKGAQGARNTGIINAKADWIVFFDSDDFMHSRFLEKMISHLIISKADIVTCFSNLIDFKTNKKIGEFTFINEGNIHDRLYSHRCYVDSNAAIIRKSKLIDIGLLDENRPIIEEWDTHLRLSRICTHSTLQKVLVDYYKGGNDTFCVDDTKWIMGYYYILNKHKDYWKKYHYYNELV